MACHNQSPVFDDVDFNTFCQRNELRENKRNFTVPSSGITVSNNGYPPFHAPPRSHAVPPFFNRPSFPHVNKSNSLIQPGSVLPGPRMCRPELPVRQSYCGPVKSSPVTFQTPNGQVERFFVPWNRSPEIYGSRRSSQKIDKCTPFETSQKLPVQPQFTYSKPHFQHQKHSDYQSFPNFPKYQNHPDQCRRNFTTHENPSHQFSPSFSAHQKPVQGTSMKHENKSVNSWRGEKNVTKPWMTNEIYQELQKKNDLYAAAKRSNSAEMWQEFRSKRNKVNSIIKSAKDKMEVLHKTKEDDLVSKPFSCDNCDRAFTDEFELGKHRKEHVKCNLEGCQFEAHPKVIRIHQKMQHETGYSKTILKLNTPSEIEKWISERKRRFPTAKNIKQRQQEHEEKTARGEIIEPKEFGKFKRGRYESTSPSKFFQKNTEEFPNRRNRQRRRRRRQQSFTKLTAQPDSDDDSDDHGKLPPFQGMLSAFIEKSQKENTEEVLDTHNSGHLISNDSSAVSKGVSSPRFRNKHAQKKGCSNETDESNSTMGVPLTSLQIVDLSPPFQKTEQNNYCNISSKSSAKLEDVIGKISDDENEGPSVVPITKRKEYSVNADGFSSNPKNNCDSFQTSTLGSDDDEPTILAISKCDPICIAVDEKIPVQTATHERQKNTSGHAQNLQKLPSRNAFAPPAKYSAKTKNNLLEKLLVKEISHERNVIFQCIRHVVNNDFFGVSVD